MREGLKEIKGKIKSDHMVKYVRRHSKRYIRQTNIVTVASKNRK